MGNSALSWLELELVFKPTSTEGVILYAGHRSDGTGDLIAITLSQAHVSATIDLGSGPLTLRLEQLRPRLHLLASTVTQARPISCNQSEMRMPVSDWLQFTGLAWQQLTLISINGS